MAYNITELNVASLDYSNIVDSLITFLEKQPELKNIDFRNNASAANMLINMMATATAYNGVYTQMGLKESFVSTASWLESVVGIASNHSILLPIKKSASAIGTTNQLVAEYTNFSGTSPDGTSMYFYNIDVVPETVGGRQFTLYAGNSVTTYTSWDFENSIMLLPLSIDPNTVSLYEITDPSDPLNTQVKWTRVDKSMTTTTDSQNIFTVLNGPNGYIVTTNFPNARRIPTSSSVKVKAIESNGSIGNNAVISDPNSVFLTITTPSGGYDLLTVTMAKAKLLFSLSQDRCVTVKDYINAIVSSNISGTENEDDVSVRSGDVPGVINVYVENLSSQGQAELISYLSNKSVAGTSIVYAQ